MIAGRWVDARFVITRFAPVEHAGRGEAALSMSTEIEPRVAGLISVGNCSTEESNGRLERRGRERGSALSR